MKMCRKILWYYILLLTLLDISLKTKLTAQGKSNGVTLHDSLLIEGINFQEWGSEAEGGGPPEGVVLKPAALHFGLAPLAVAHARPVTLFNHGNTTLHLASVAGTTPDFHASFFESKMPKVFGKPRSDRLFILSTGEFSYVNRDNSIIKDVTVSFQSSSIV